MAGPIATLCNTSAERYVGSVISAFSPDSPLTRLVVPSPNHGPRKDGKRANCVILHYTGMPTAERAIGWLANPESQVSAHYVVREDGEVIQMVAESERAWHAGRGSWQGETDMNSVSIGIEIAHPGHPNADPTKPCADFPDGQIASVIALTKNIVQRHRLDPLRVLAHSDIAPRRKIDPGERFPWARLAEAGLGLYVKAHPVSGGRFLAEGDEGQPVAALKAMLGMLGFGVSLDERFDEELTFTVKAFQRHFRPEKIDGVADASTISTLRDLLRIAPARSGETLSV
jgi:N-acetylmuramoyl-L-alanine amidase